MQQFQVSVHISASAETVWQLLTDVEHWHEWTPSISSITWLDAAKMEVGSRAVVKQPQFPPVTWQVTKVCRHSFTWASRTPGLQVSGIHTVEDDGIGCTATLAIRMQGPLAWIWGVLTRRITLKYLNMEAEGLKAKSEGLNLASA